jgi:hypothetical protein
LFVEIEEQVKRKKIRVIPCVLRVEKKKDEEKVIY